ncbi:MAG: metalloregulator ArsR/SmtB family transcription factor [Eubacteriales bacterium]|nr:metalloregulator ArsR/SmtB family transcription factor [Eubacteriales bacterium]
MEVTERTCELSEKLKALSHPCRLRIVQDLLDHDCSVTNIQTALQIPQPSISAHLARLRTAGIIEGHRQGQEIHYEVIDPDTLTLVKALF